MGTCQEKAVLYKPGLRNSVVHLKVVTLQLMTAFGLLSIEGNIKCVLQYDLQSYIQPLIFW